MSVERCAFAKLKFDDLNYYCKNVVSLRYGDRCDPSICDAFHGVPVPPSGSSQTAKADVGKPRLSLVPTQIIFDIARIREYGNKKYHDPDNWKTVEPERYRDAAFRHFLAYINDPNGVDEESGLPHLWHLECNLAFLSEMQKGEFKECHS